MSLAWCYRRAFSGALGDLIATKRENGLIGFGETTALACPGPVSPRQVTQATGWRPMLASFSYTATAAATASPANIPAPSGVHGVALYFTEKLIEGITPALSTPGNPRWAERWFIEPAVHTVYATGVLVPVSSENGSPWDLRIVTDGKPPAADVLVTVDWGWQRQGGTNVTRDQLDALIEELKQQREHQG